MNERKKYDLHLLQSKYAAMCVAFDYTEGKGTVEIPLVPDSFPVRLMSDSGEVANIKANSLPPLVVKFWLDHSHPYVRPTLSISNEVVSEAEIARINEEMVKIWSQKRDRTLIDMFDYAIRQCHNNLQQLIGPSFVTRSQSLYQYLVKFNENQAPTRPIHCDICQHTHKALECLSFESCNHLFGKSCLADYFASAVSEGHIDKIHCPNMECNLKHHKLEKARYKFDPQTKLERQIEKFIINTLTPPVSRSFLLTVWTEDKPQDLVDRYIKLYKLMRYNQISTFLPNRVDKCPQEGCEEVMLCNPQDRLIICTKCKFTFCNMCCKPYHTDYNRCFGSLETNEKIMEIPVEILKKYQDIPDGLQKKEINSRYDYHVIQKAIKELDKHRQKQTEEWLAQFRTIIKPCPRCNTYIEYLGGCLKVHCKCGFYFCFQCLGEIKEGYYHSSEGDNPCQGTSYRLDKDVIEMYYYDWADFAFYRRDMYEPHADKTTLCPFCNHEVVSLGGLNEMSCTYCLTTFCYLCRSVALGDHYTEPSSQCYGKYQIVEDIQQKWELGSADYLLAMDKESRKFFKQNSDRIKPCPRCKTLVENNSECNAVGCPFCMCSYCFLCSSFALPHPSHYGPNSACSGKYDHERRMYRESFCNWG